MQLLNNSYILCLILKIPESLTIGFQKLWESYQQMNGKELLVITQPSQWLYEFDSNGKCVCMGEMLFSSGEAMDLEK